MKKSILSLGIASLAIAFVITSCTKEEELPPIGGYNTADEVGASNLVA